MSFFVYILYSSVRERYYIGQTADMEQRIEAHNNGKVKSTSSGAPWSVVYSIEVDSRSTAMLLEQKIKKRGAKRYLLDLEK